MRWNWNASCLAVALAGALFVSMPVSAAEEQLQVELIRKVFRLNQPEWPPLLRDNSGLLDDSFFERVDKRIRWSIDNNQVDDAIRFSMLGDMAADAANRRSGYRLALIMAFQKSGNDELAKQLVDNVMLTHPSSPEVRYLRAAYRRAGADFGGAREDYEFLIGQGYNVAECYYYLGEMSLIGEKEDQAKREFEKAHALKPELPGLKEILEKLSYLNQSGGGAFEAIPTTGFSASDVGAVDPKMHASYQKQALAALQAGKLPEAELQFKRTLVAQPKDALAWINLGVVHFRMGRSLLASEDLRRGLNLTPKDSEAWRMLGTCLEREFDKARGKKELEGARFAYQRALEIRPNDAISRASLARVQQKLSQSTSSKSAQP